MSKHRFNISKKSIFAILALALLCTLLFVTVETRQGINYKPTSYRMPLFIKIIEFVDRDYQYRRIVKEITVGKVSGEDKVLTIFSWCVNNIKHQPKELPVVDDHPLNIIIRGYGEGDQFEDIFTILCTYAGFESFYRKFYLLDGGRYFISFVKIDGEWYPFSVYYNAYAVSGSRPASVGDVIRDPAAADPLVSNIPGIEVKEFMAEVSKMTFKASSVRVKGQSPIGRLLCILRDDK